MRKIVLFFALCIFTECTLLGVVQELSQEKINQLASNMTKLPIVTCNTKDPKYPNVNAYLTGYTLIAVVSTITKQGTAKKYFSFADNEDVQAIVRGIQAGFGDQVDWYYIATEEKESVVEEEDEEEKKRTRTPPPTKEKSLFEKFFGTDEK